MGNAMTTLTWEQLDHLLDALEQVDTGCRCCSPDQQEVREEILKVLVAHGILTLEVVT